MKHPYPWVPAGFTPAQRRAYDAVYAAAMAATPSVKSPSGNISISNAVARAAADRVMQGHPEADVARTFASVVGHYESWAWVQKADARLRKAARERRAAEANG